MSNRLHVAGTRLAFTAETQRAHSKTIVDIHALSKRILGTAIEVVSVKRGNSFFYLLQSQRTLRLCGEKPFFNLGILGN